MKVSVYDWPTRFLVQSETDPDDEYLVDLQEHKGNGCCGCPHFSIRIEELLRTGGKPPVTHCKHITRARAWLGELLVRDLLTQETLKLTTHA